MTKIEKFHSEWLFVWAIFHFSEILFFLSLFYFFIIILLFVDFVTDMMIHIRQNNFQENLDYGTKHKIIEYFGVCACVVCFVYPMHVIHMKLRAKDEIWVEIWLHNFMFMAYSRIHFEKKFQSLFFSFLIRT